jgi:hypothetical protein
MFLLREIICNIVLKKIMRMKQLIFKFSSPLNSCCSSPFHRRWFLSVKCVFMLSFTVGPYSPYQRNLQMKSGFCLIQIPFWTCLLYLFLPHVSFSQPDILTKGSKLELSQERPTAGSGDSALCELQVPLSRWVAPGKGPFPWLSGE